MAIFKRMGSLAGTRLSLSTASVSRRALTYFTSLLYLFTLITRRNTYLTNPQPINIHDLTLAVDCNLPTTQHSPAGRPCSIKHNTVGSRQRYIAPAQASLNTEVLPPERGTGSQASMLCGEYGHNRWSCMCDQSHKMSNRVIFGRPLYLAWRSETLPPTPRRPPKHLSPLCPLFCLVLEVLISNST